jgi:hypothetical protein
MILNFLCGELRDLEEKPLRKSHTDPQSGQIFEAMPSRLYARPAEASPAGIEGEI